MHWYGVPESLLEDRTVQHFRVDYNYNNKMPIGSARLEDCGLKLRRLAAKRGTKIIDEFIEAGLTMTPTFTIYEACRDVTRVKRTKSGTRNTAPSLMTISLQAHETTVPSSLIGPQPTRSLGRENFRTWMQFINDYKNRGGRVTTGPTLASSTGRMDSATSASLSCCRRPGSIR